MNFKFTKEWTKSFFMMIIAVILMGMCVAMLVLSDMGTDPYSAMNYGISARLGMTFGNYQLISNLVLLVLVVIFERKLIGTGTLGNMILVGYSADFFSWVFKDISCTVTSFTWYASRLSDTGTYNICCCGSSIYAEWARYSSL